MAPDRAIVEKTSARLDSSGEVILAVGLTRPFAPSTEHQQQSAHWLQVNNIHLEDDPTWQLG